MNTHIFYRYLNEKKSNLIGYKYYVNSLEKYSTIKKNYQKLFIIYQILNSGDIHLVLKLDQNQILKQPGVLMFLKF